MTKPVKRVDLSKLTPEQRAAFTQLYRDAQSVAPQMGEFQQMAQTLFTELLKAPKWSAAEGPGDKPAQELWSIGSPEVNYVDHIERPT
jgi:hypothetical protein